MIGFPPEAHRVLKELLAWDPAQFSQISDWVCSEELAVGGHSVIVLLSQSPNRSDSGHLTHVVILMCAVVSAYCISMWLLFGRNSHFSS